MYSNTFQPLDHPVVASNQTGKNRLYVVFSTQRHRWEPEIKYHTSLILSPKKPASPTALESWRYQVAHTMRDRGIGWEYESTQVANGGPEVVEGPNGPVGGIIVAAVMLSKIDLDISPTQLSVRLREVPVWETAEDRGARQWIWRAIRHLENENLIPPLHINPDQLWKNGYQFAEGVENELGFPGSVLEAESQAVSGSGRRWKGKGKGKVNNSKIPVCDVFGYRLKSELRRT
ncbi:hypothetical protein JAAARDRAFT_36987 [Jaapia argillacea MUCL 33604]|uniref:Uncharacterized protein n=1 Tax=Jaapia argillacea MUCL 33604 TaxID=933084 RepID=A0A067PL80_9AGAM|nr:hypothetical protein JAAARDRAFT_36987 [Jaapia argillacea MUCL 33604]